MKYDVFISYSRKDMSIADAICKALKNVGITYFIDKQGIGGGTEFPLVLADAICESEIFLFLASENSYTSKYTNSEITFAFNEKPHERILPYIIDKSTLPRHLRFVFSSITWRNIHEHPIETVLVQDLLQLLGKKELSPTDASIYEYDGDADADFNSAYNAWSKGEYNKAFPVFLRLAKCGYKKAFGYVGLCYELGRGVSRDYNQMLSYYMKAIEAQEYLGVYRLGMHYTNKGDFDKSRQLYEKAIEEGWATGDAYMTMARMCEKGQGGNVDINKAIQYYRVAHQYNEREASSALHRLGIFDEVSLPETVLRNSAQKLYMLGMQNNEGHDANQSIAFAFFKAAAAKGHPLAANRVVMMHGDGWPIDDEEIIKEYREYSTREMVIWVRNDSQYAWDAGYSYQYGRGCHASIDKAEECYRIGAESGDASCRWKLGTIAMKKGNTKEAYSHYKIAAESGQGMAMFELANCYENGIGTSPDLAKAIHWYEICSRSRFASTSDAKRKYEILKKRKLL